MVRWWCFVNLRYEGGIVFPRWIIGKEAVALFRNIAESGDFDFEYLFNSEESVYSRKGEESSLPTIELIGTLSKQFTSDDGNVLAIQFYSSNLSSGNDFTGLLIGDRYEDRTGRGLGLMSRCLESARRYADENFRDKDKTLSYVFGRDEIERAERRYRRGEGKLMCVLAGIP